MNLYTTVAELTRKQWKTGAHPAPKSIVEDEDDEWPAPQKEEHPAIERELAEAEADGTLSSRPRSLRPYGRKPERTPTPQEHLAHRETMRKKFPEGWAPPRKVSREAMDALRHLHQLDPVRFSTPLLADKFRISVEAVRRILKSKWEPTREQKARMAEREREARRRWKVQKREEEQRKYDKAEEERAPLHGRGEEEEDRLTFT